MPKFYVMDHGCYGASDWTENSVEIDARSEEHAAETDGDCVAGQKFEVVVATQADGSDARLYAGRCIIDIRYEVRGSSKPYEVKSPQPDSDGEAEAQP